MSPSTDCTFPPIRRRRSRHRLEDTTPRNTTTKTSHHTRYRSRSISPGEQTPNSRPYTPVSTSHYDPFSDPAPFRRPMGVLSTANSMSEPPTKYISPFISTKSRPSLYQRAVSNTTPSSKGRQGGNRSRTEAASSVNHPPVHAPSFVYAMVPPDTSSFFPKPQKQADREENYKRDSDMRSSFSSRESTSNSSTGNSSAHGRGKNFVAKLKSFVKGDGHGTDNMTMIYLTPEEVRERDIRIRKARHIHAAPTGALGI